MGFYSDLMGFYSDLMGFYRDLMECYSDSMGYEWDMVYQWIGLREFLREKPHMNSGKIDGFQLRFSRRNQSIE